MVRLTADLIWKSPHFFNAIKERELDLRGNKIPVIENLGATEFNDSGFAFAIIHQDQFDTIDLSDNEIVKLENMPYLNRLGTLIINNNRITRINPNIGEYLPKLHTLVLTNNRLVNLAEIDPLSSLPKLQFLSLLDNTITKKPNYRLYVIHKLKSLRVLDFKKVKAKERAEAEHLFSSKEVEEEAKRESVKSFTPGEIPNIPEVAEEQQDPKVVAPTPEQIIAIKAAIVNSQTLEEVARLEKALNSGQLPADLKILDDTGSNSVKEQDDKMATDSQNEAEPNNLEEQKDNEATPMEQHKDVHSICLAGWMVLAFMFGRMSMALKPMLAYPNSRPLKALKMEILFHQAFKAIHSFLRNKSYFKSSPQGKVLAFLDECFDNNEVMVLLTVYRLTDLLLIERVLVRRKYLASKAREYLQRLIKRENGSRDPSPYWKMQEISKEASAMIEGHEPQPRQEMVMVKLEVAMSSLLSLSILRSRVPSSIDMGPRY
ncbi:hypothetical protein POTOM_014206 [Populus tomentosa]|uniref:U2A'/phosphoprotein 32 family A C-terminal domain-containing protein n=1 Tax=Populus tomentosa TaxID=118781 RepID=A0A8X8D894_POPTO|nr:hypothetical protein POTOM_014206 [Populus tomentosa]